ncbi:MAG: hypothetical protein LUD51_07250 [Clostridia bacterium]|nr:hypothetical protein [Clostridia bacterium]
MSEEKTMKNCMNEPHSNPEDMSPEDLDAVLDEAAEHMREEMIKRDGPEPVDGKEFFAWLKKKYGTGTLYDGNALAEDFKYYQEECRIARLLNEAIDEAEAGAEPADGEEFLESLRLKYGSQESS